MTNLLQINPEIYTAEFVLGDDCHLWFLDLTQLPDAAINQQQIVLSGHELTRARALKRRKQEFIAMRAFVRLCLSRYTQTDPANLELQSTSKGKPFLANAKIPIKFNLSHCNNFAVLAIGLQFDIGVDIESITRNRSQREIAARYFHPREVVQLESLNETDHNIYFFRLWTLKEAFLKATGDGISAGLEKAEFALDGEKITAQLADDLQTHVDNWQFYQTFITSEFCVALARHDKQAINVRWFNGMQLFL